MTNQKRAYLYAGIAIFFWSTVASAFKIALRHLDFYQLLFIASWTSFLILLITAVFQKKTKIILNTPVSGYLRSAIYGFLNPFLYYIILFKAYSLLPAQVAQPLNMIWPIVLVFLSVPFLKQKIAKKSFIALFISFIGVYLIASVGKPFDLKINEPFGVVLATGSSIIWSFFWILNMRDERDELDKLVLNFFFASLYITLITAIMSEIPVSYNRGTWLAGYSGAFEMGFTFLFWLKALQLSTTTDRVSNLVFLAPFFSLIVIHIFVGETIYLTTLLGLVFIVAGIIIEKIR
jgi:drug/metabolite transporter (DMT)-like permease